MRAGFNDGRRVDVDDSWCGPFNRCGITDGAFRWDLAGDGQVKLHLPDAHADFIFSVAAEEYGLLACLFLIGLFGFVVIRGYAQSLIARDMFSMLAVSGLATQFGVQAAIHMASSLNLIPTKGMTLPFISYGGSSLMASGLTLGLILALSRKQHPSEVSHFDHPAMMPEASR